METFTTTPEEATEIRDISQGSIEIAVDQVSKSANKRFTEGATKTLFRVNRQQAIALALVSGLSYPIGRTELAKVAGQAYDLYAAIPAGAYYLEEGKFPSLDPQEIKSRHQHGYNDCFFVAQKYYDGVVISNFPRGSMISTVDRSVQISWDLLKQGWGPWGSSFTTFYSEAKVVAKKPLEEYLKEGFKIFAGKRFCATLSRYQMWQLGGYPLSGLRKLTTAEDFIGYTERFLGRSEVLLPPIEEVYSLGIHKAEQMTLEEILAEVSRRVAANQISTKRLLASGTY
ncbi:hypothetical protein M1563_00785 [Patescibacteria group bacterium]|nr:hypothetical protein [Patescibacteria group bacterium]MCL5410151.1 hypothetical protein [Patescibacteria group bacterium]